MTAEDIFKALFLMLCDTETGKATVSKRVLQAIPDNWMGLIKMTPKFPKRIQIEAHNPELITHIHHVEKTRPVDMNTETIFKILFALLCFRTSEEIEANKTRPELLKQYGILTDENSIEMVPDTWMKTLHLDKAGLDLYRLQVKNEDKPLLWSKDIMVPINN